jgi:AcrR family transcriptional regulator
VTQRWSRVERHKKETRQRMVEAGRVLLVAEGLDGLSSQGVTTETDVALGTFYHHFAGKETLIEEIVSEDDRRNSAAAAALADPPQSPVRALTSLVTATTITAALVDDSWTTTAAAVTATGQAPSCVPPSNWLWSIFRHRPTRTAQQSHERGLQNHEQKRRCSQT